MNVWKSLHKSQMAELNSPLMPRLQTTSELALSKVFITSKLAFSAVAVAEAKRTKKAKI